MDAFDFSLITNKQTFRFGEFFEKFLPCQFSWHR